jgi:hypothetical protein
MAWLPSSRHAVHRRLRFPDLRTGSDSPLRTKTRHCLQRTSPSRGLSTPRIPQSGLNATSRTQSLQSVSSSPAQSLAASRGVHVVSSKDNLLSYDTVVLEAPQPAPVPHRAVHRNASRNQDRQIGMNLPHTHANFVGGAVAIVTHDRHTPLELDHASQSVVPVCLQLTRGGSSLRIGRVILSEGSISSVPRCLEDRGSWPPAPPPQAAGDQRGSGILGRRRRARRQQRQPHREAVCPGGSASILPPMPSIRGCVRRVDLCKEHGRGGVLVRRRWMPLSPPNRHKFSHEIENDPLRSVWAAKGKPQYE